MGLDMYLTARRYVSGYKHNKDELFDGLTKLIGVDADEESPSCEVSLTVGYWRKANAIHRWFVENVQDGEDECREHTVSLEKLKALGELCRRVLSVAKTEEKDLSVQTVIENKDVIATLLPTQEGFFFGSTRYDSNYLHDVKRALEIIDKVLKLDWRKWSFSYRSSW